MFKWKICFVCLLSLMLFTIPMLALVGISSPSPDVNQAGLAISSEGQSASIETDTQAQEDDSLATLAEAGVWHSDGYFQILDESTGKVNKVSERDYVIGAVCAEMPPTFHTEALKAQYEGKLTDARHEAAKIVADAQNRAQRVYEGKMAEAETDAKRLRSEAEAQIAEQRDAMLRGARNEVASLALLAAAKVAQRSMDGDDDKAFVDTFLSEVGEQA